MKRGTTPTITLKITGCEINQFDKIYITFQQGNITIEKLLKDIEIKEDLIYCKFTQEETLRFNQGNVSIQLRAVDSNGVAIASDIKTVPVERILKEGVI